MHSVPSAFPKRSLDRQNDRRSLGVPLTGEPSPQGTLRSRSPGRERLAGNGTLWAVENYGADAKPILAPSLTLAPARAFARITPAEARVLDALVEHGNNKLIARVVGISHRTVGIHLCNIRRKLREAGHTDSLTSRVLLMRWWMERQAQEEAA